ncbi:hypothetical protein DB88DRAFT_91768 [Papiliotrema laurentii]|uniref:Uncharacterized protein n=1 Tax=Papiliotrema laurentii TaxID=5418 RepID=A0AAD9CS46_PAPLA|nr:hypothetical protein DB88DRAFT_91768 [Papiliotrema laurentii]
MTPPVSPVSSYYDESMSDWRGSSDSSQTSVSAASSEAPATLDPFTVLLAAAALSGYPTTQDGGNSASPGYTNPSQVSLHGDGIGHPFSAGTTDTAAGPYDYDSSSEASTDTGSFPESRGGRPPSLQVWDIAMNASPYARSPSTMSVSSTTTGSVSPSAWSVSSSPLASPSVPASGDRTTLTSQAPAPTIGFWSTVAAPTAPGASVYGTCVTPNTSNCRGADN